MSTQILTDSFTGSNGDPLGAGWTTGYTGTGASTAIQGNRGRWLTGTAGGYAGTARISRKAVVTSPADFECVGTYTPQGETYPEIYCRASDTVFDTQSGYALRLPTQGGDGNLRIKKYVAYAGSDLGTAAFSATSGTTYGFRFRVVGSALKGRIWDTAGAEPSTWNIEVTNGDISAAGYVGVSVGAGNTASTYVDFDDVTMWDGSSDVDKAATGETLALADAATVEVSATAAETLALADAASVEASTSLAETLTLADAATVEVFELRHDLVVEIEFEDGVWTDVSDYVVAEDDSVGTFGRPTRFDDVAASTWDVNLRNSDGRFTPGNPNSPYYPNVVKGRRFRVSVTYSGQTYPRFWGKISGLTLPAITDVESATATVQAADIMADLARKTLLSPFVEESRRVARNAAGGGVDVFPFPASSVKADGSIKVADTSFENKGVLFPGSTRYGTVSIMAAGNGAGQVKSSGADTDGGVLSEGQLDFEVGDNGEGKQAHPVLVAKPQVGFRQMELFFKVPEGVLPPRYKTGTYTVPADGDGWNTPAALYGMTQAELAALNPDAWPDALALNQVINISANTLTSEWVLADLWAGSTEVLRIVLGSEGGNLVLIARKPTGGAAYIANTGTLADGKWRKLTLYRTGADSIRCNLNDSPAGAGMTGLAGDLAAVDTVYVTGRADPTQAAGKQTQCPPCSIGGLAFQATVTGVWYWYCLGAPPANVTAAERFSELAGYASPISVQTGTAWHSSLDRPFDVKVVRTPTTGRSLLDCMQELARTVGGYLWVQPDDGYLTLRKGPTPPLSLATIDLEADADTESAPQWRDTVDVQPTRITAKCPAGEVTSVNTAAEAAGAYKDGTVETCAAAISVAKAVADRYLVGQSTLHLTNLQVDLMHAESSLWGAFLPVFLPTERVLRLEGIPQAVLGFSAIDATVESWTERYTVDSAKFAFQTTPAGASVAPPHLAGFTVTSSVGTQTAGVLAAAQPAGTSSGDLLVAIATVDDTGTASSVTATSEWTARGSGSASAGYGWTWTKTASASEPTSYQFDVAGIGGGSTLLSDSFTGSNGAGLGGNWTTGEATTGATATIQDNAARLDPGTLTGYAGRMSVLADITDRANVGVVFSFRQANNDSFPVVYLRGDAGGLGSDGYQFRPGFTADGHRLRAVSSWVESDDLANIPGSITPGTWYRVRFQAIGSSIKARVWQVGQTEPSSWGLEVSDSTVTAAGTVYLVAAGGNAVGSTVDVDDVTVYDPTASGLTFPEAKLTVLRVAGADTADPLLVAPSWSSDAAATTSHVAPSVAPASAGLLVAHWHILPGDPAVGGGGGGGSSTNRSTLPWANGVFDNTLSTAKVDAFASMSGQEIDFYDTHPTWGDITASNWWYSPHVGRGYNVMLSVPMYGPGGVGVNSAAMWTTAANILKDNGWTAPYVRLGIEYNLSNDWKCTDGNISSWKARFVEASNAIKAVIPNARIVLCPNEGNGGGELSQANTIAVADDLAAYYDVIAPDYYDQWEPITNDSERDARFDAATFGSIGWWLAKANTLGKGFGLGEWGVSSGYQWAPHAGGDNPYYVGAVMDWAATNGAEMLCYFEEADDYLDSDITTTATNPNARAMYRSKIAQYAGS